VEFGRLGIPADVPLFICPGTPFKYRPQDDWVLVEIARRLGRCAFIFFQHERAELSRKLRSRMADAFRREGLDADRHLISIPWLPRPAFLGLMLQADVYLDTIGFSGFNTLMQALQVQLPGVTFEGRFMRGRLGSGILRHLGLPELVATCREDYVDVAVKLAESPVYRSRLRDRLRAAQHCAYADRGAVSALESALRT
jgi:predicted O-linked N-acetylglucosamine transferase (SPINDLY family)